MKSQSLLAIALLIGLPAAYFLGSMKHEPSTGIPVVEEGTSTPGPESPIPSTSPSSEFTQTGGDTPADDGSISGDAALEEPRSDFLGGYRDDFSLIESSRPMTSQEDVFMGQKTQLKIPEVVHEMSGFYELTITLNEAYRNEKITGFVRIFFRSLDELNSDSFFGVADSSLYDSDDKIWRRMTGKKSRNLKLTNPFEFGFNPKSGAFTGAESAAILSQKLADRLWPEPILPVLKRLNLQGHAEKDETRSSYTGTITGDISVKRPSAGSRPTDGVVGVFQMKRVGL